MNRYGGPRSQASASTTCQKCLQKGHYSYECKASVHERPYRSRPSRTQQLLNPGLKPKLASDTPDPVLRQDGVADEHLAKLNAERGRKRRRSDGSLSDSRSLSASSMSSVSTISTNLSRSPSPPKSKRSGVDGYHHIPVPKSRQEDPIEPSQNSGYYQRRSSPSSVSSRSSKASRRGAHRRRHHENGHRRMRRRREYSSPHARGRRHSRSRTRRRTSRDSLDRSRVARNRRTVSPRSHRGHVDGSRRAPTHRDNDVQMQDVPDHGRRRRPSPSPLRDRSMSPYSRRIAMSRQHGRAPHSFMQQQTPKPPPPRERSLSPYSKRLALTQAMNL